MARDDTEPCDRCEHPLWAHTEAWFNERQAFVSHCESCCATDAKPNDHFHDFVSTGVRTPQGGKGE